MGATAKAQVITDEDEQINQASALWARSKSEITDEQYHEFYKHVGARLRVAAGVHARPGRGPPGIHAAALHAEAGAVRSLGPRAPPRHQALRPARVHHGRCRAADAAVPALRARGDRLERPAAQRLARDPAAVARRRSRSATTRSSACSACSKISPSNRGRQVRDVLEGVRPRAQGRRRRGHRQPRAHRQAAALRVDARRDRRADGLARRLRRPDEGGPGQRSTTSPPTALPRRRTARTSRSSASWASKCC